MKLQVEIERAEPYLAGTAEDWAFHLDLWQNPYTVARYYRRAVCGARSTFDAMRPIMKMLANARAAGHHRQHHAQALGRTDRKTITTAWCSA